mmetsp:Transcript_23458/g.54496  ORF Transcript_23458/g.54496 Transcript_23458/m.54496 type:complete len:227 (-) Transcript_23458:76-756(-)
MMDALWFLFLVIVAICQCHAKQFHLFRRRGRRPIHSLVQDLDGQFQCRLGIGFIVFRLEEGFASLIVCTNDGSLPATVISGRIALVELEAVLGIIAGEQKGHAKGSEPTVLRVGLLVITDVLHELLDGNGFLVLVPIPTSPQSGLIHEDVGIGRETRDIASDVRTQFIRLFRSLGRSQQTTGDSLFTGHYNAILCKDSYTCTSIVDCFDRIFDLMKTSLGRECCRG